MNLILSLNDVSKVYDNGTVALAGVNLSIKSGEFVSLVGSSGCGKSTILRLIAGLGESSSGRIDWQQTEKQPELAFVFQEAALLPWAKVIDNVILPLKLSGLPIKQARIRCSQAISLVGLNGFEKAYPHQLSGGMKMRVSIARALVTHPHVMLMDEPFGALDEITRSKLHADFLQLWQQQAWTVLFVTHNLYEAVYLSTRVVVMGSRPGKIITEVVIDAPYPRGEDFRTSRLCNDYCREIASYLQDIYVT